MRTQTLHWTSSLFLVVTLGVAGCPKDDGGEETGGDSTGSSGGETSATMSASSTSASTTASTTDSTTASTTATSTDTEPGTISATETGTTGTEPQPNGAMCDDDAGCESGLCYQVGPLPGICGECKSDADCADITGGGCSIPNPLSTPPQGAHCNMGEPGQGCETTDVCAEGVCAVVLDVPGILTASTCGECATDADCMDGDLCSPTYDVLMLSGENVCVAPGTVPDGTGCALDGNGDMACESGHCAGADVLGVAMLGVCNPCEVDADCNDGETCELPSIDLMMGLVPGGCVAM